MTELQTRKRQEIIEKLISYAKSAKLPDKKLVAKRLPLLEAFIQQFYANAPLEDLETRSVANLYCSAFAHWNLLYRQEPNTSKIHIFNPLLEENGWESTHTIVQINVRPDMPFLVNSVRMELNRLNLTIHLVINPVCLQAKS